jgi:acyl-CoA thioesterase
MDDPTSFFEADVFARHTGIKLLEVSPGRARVKMEIGEQHMNSHGTVHGGAIFTLADTAFALASNSHGVPAAAINAHISYLTAARAGVLYAEAEEFARNPKLASYTVQVTDEHGAKIAIFQGMVYRKTTRG